MLNIAILAIGNEVLCGKVVDTNSSFIAREAEKIGAKIVHKQVISDNEDELLDLNNLIYMLISHVDYWWLDYRNS